MDDDVRAVFYGAQLVRRRKCRVDDERDLVLVCDFGDGFDVDEVGVGVADRFDVDELRIVLDGVRKGVDAFFRVDEGRCDAEVGEGMLEEIVCAAVERRRRDDVMPGMGKPLQRRRDRRCA